MRITLAALLMLHGLLHLLGFLKPFGLAKLGGMTGQALVPLSTGAARAVGVLWLAATVVFVSAAVLRLFDARSWWLVAGAGVVVSQGLIIFMWHDAKAGTVANVAIALAVIAAAGLAAFDARVQREGAALLEAAPRTPAPPVQAEELEALPPPIRRWLLAAGVVGRPRTQTVRLTQSGQMRLKAGGAWMPVQAEQYFDVEAPAFSWSVKTKLADALPIVGRDRYAEGHGNMLIKALGLVTVANGTGREIDQGTALRFLAEIVWFPSAALSPLIRWEPLDDATARATMTVAGTTVSADFSIDAGGRFTRLTAQRYYAPVGRGPTLHTWEIPARAWRRFDGVEVPSQGDAVWKLPEGDLNYFRWRIERLEHGARRTFADEPARAPSAPPRALPAHTTGARPLQSQGSS